MVIENGIHNGAFLFEKDVQERVIQMGLITKEEIDRKTPFLYFDDEKDSAVWF